MTSWNSLRILTLLVVFITSIVQAQLTAGDIAVIAHNNDDPDRIAILCLVDIPQGTQITFTDKGWTGTGFTNTEGTFSWIAPMDYPKGATVDIFTSGMSLATTGDQIFAFQGTLAAPTLLYGLSSRPWVTSGSVSANTSYLPAMLLASGAHHAHPSERDNGYFNLLSHTSDKQGMLLALQSSSNWSLSDTRYAAWPAWNLTILGIGSEPTAQPTSLTFPDVRPFNFGIRFMPPPSPPDGYLAIWRTGGTPTAVPADGVAYMVGDQVGDGKVAFVGTSTSLLQEGVVAATAYHYLVFSYNGSGSAINYRQTAPLAGSVTTTATEVGAYYDGIDPGSPAFLDALRAKIADGFQKVPYDQYDEAVVAHFGFSDTSGGKRALSCAYTGSRYAYQPPFEWYSSSPFSREHTYCHSWMPSYPLTGPDEYADLFHLFPVHQTGANAVRSNHPLGEVATVITSYLDGTYGLDSTGHYVYEPRDYHKGDAARAMLYMSIRYHNVGGADWSFAQLNGVTLPALGEGPQSVETLRLWNVADPVDAYESARNDFIHSIQGNRNPFIDHPEWVQNIDFNTMMAMQGPSKAGTALPSSLLISIDPNPAHNRTMLTVHCQGRSEEVVLTIIDATAKVVLQRDLSLQEGINSLPLDLSLWAPGIYTAVVLGTHERRHARFVIL